MNRTIAGVLVLGAVSLTASMASAQALSSADSCAIGAGGNVEVHALIYGGAGGGAAVWESVPCRKAREFESLTTAAHLAHADGNEAAAMRYRAAADALLCSVDDMAGNPMCAGVPQAAAARATPYPAVSAPIAQVTPVSATSVPATLPVLPQPDPQPVRVASLGSVETSVPPIRHDDYSAQICAKWHNYNDWNRQRGLQLRPVPEQCRDAR